MKPIITSIAILISTIAFSQTKDLSALPTYDCSLKKIMKIISGETILVSPDKSAGLDAILADYCSTLGANCIQKKESDLKDSDFKKSLFLVGVLQGFKKWEKYRTAVKKTDKGFVINKKTFNSASDGFVLVDTSLIIVSGNSLKAVKAAQLALTGGHDILITQNGKITFFGNRKGQQFNWFNLQSLKVTNYTEKPSQLFSAIYVSKTFKDTIDYIKLTKDLKLYAKQFLSAYRIKKPVSNFCWFIHSNMQEYGTMSGLFGFTCPGNNSGGFSIRGEIHTKGFNTKLVKHEYSHFLFDSAIPQDNNPAFFVEGCVEYVSNLNDSNLYKQRVAIAKTFKDTLNYADLIINNKDFYGQYSDADYSICGVFVKYIIDNYGVENFKKYCLAGNKQITTGEIFEIKFEDFIEGYKRWLSGE
jgi:hypothetical protein